MSSYILGIHEDILFLGFPLLIGQFEAMDRDGTANLHVYLVGDYGPSGLLTFVGFDILGFCHRSDGNAPRWYA